MAILYAATWLFLSLLLFSLVACGGKHIPVNPPGIEVHKTFSIKVLGPDTFAVSAQGPQGEADAKEYLCTTAYICMREELPIHVYKINRKRK